MMGTDLITEENLNEFEDFLPADVGENIRRTNYYGLAFRQEDGTVESVVIWNLKDYEIKSKDTTAFVEWIGAVKYTAGEVVMDGYENMMKVAGTKKSFAEIPVNEEAKKLTDTLRIRRSLFREEMKPQGSLRIIYSRALPADSASAVRETRSIRGRFCD